MIKNTGTKNVYMYQTRTEINRKWQHMLKYWLKNDRWEKGEFVKKTNTLYMSIHVSMHVYK